MPRQITNASEAREWLEARERRKRELFRALSEHALSDGELTEVAEFGSKINVEMNVPYNPEEKGRELTNALLMQQILQLRSTNNQ